MSVLEQIKALENGKGIQHLLDSAYMIFNNPLYMVDSYYNLIAASDFPAGIPALSVLKNTGTFSLQQKENMVKAGIFDIIANAKKPLLLGKKENWNHTLITGAIVNRDNKLIGQMTMHEYYTPFNTESLAAFEALIEKITYEIRDYDYFTKLSIKFFESTVNKLLDKTTQNTEVHHSQARIIRQGFEKYLYVAVVGTERNNISENVHRSRLEYFRGLLKTIYKFYRYAIYLDKIVILMSSKNKDFHEALPLGGDYDIFKVNNLFVGVSRSFEDIYEFSMHYDQAVKALNDGKKDHDSERVFLY